MSDNNAQPVAWRGVRAGLKASVSHVTVTNDRAALLGQGYNESEIRPLYEATVSPEELARLREIEHSAWHVLESCEHRVEDNELVLDLPDADYDKLSGLLSEGHPENASADSGAAAPKTALNPAAAWPFPRERP